MVGAVVCAVGAVVCAVGAVVCAVGAVVCAVGAVVCAVGAVVCAVLTSKVTNTAYKMEAFSSCLQGWGKCYRALHLHT